MKYYIIGGILLLAIGYGAGRYVQPAKVVTKLQTVTNDVVHDHIHTVIQTVTLPSGEKKSTTTIDNDKNETASTNTVSSSVTTYSKPQWRAQGLAGLNLKSVSTPVYGIGIERRILGPIFAGAYGKNNGEVGISVSLEF